MRCKRSIFVSLQVEGSHRYKEAPQEVAFLRSYHRHMFGVRVKMEVFHDDRELEFILVKRFIQRFFNDNPIHDVDWSCEMIADKLHRVLVDHYGDRDMTIVVDEDGENGAEVQYYALEKRAVRQL